MFRKRVYDKFDSLPEKQKIGDTDYKKNTEISIKVLNNILDSVDCQVELNTFFKNLYLELNTSLSYIFFSKNFF